MSNRADLAHEMQTVLRALDHARALVAGLDQADTARKLTDRLAYSPLRTLLEHAEQAAARVVAHLGVHGSARLDQPKSAGTAGSRRSRCRDGPMARTHPVPAPHY